jgi:phytanoyl-CoA hydroxylase
LRASRRSPRTTAGLKSAGYGAPIEWHQDWVFYPHTNKDLAAVGIMLDDCDMDNSPMTVIPGSHQGPIYGHHGPDGRFCGAIDPEAHDLDLSRAMPCLRKAGSIAVHHLGTVHGFGDQFLWQAAPVSAVSVRAANAWPLFGLKEGIGKFDELLLVGEPSLTPRLAPVPARMPLLPAE